MSAESQDTLAPANVVTVEPGIYLEGVGGIRIEDDVVVTTNGIENLTNLRKDVIDLG
jgi:Xaa-Pro dipeptidase